MEVRVGEVVRAHDGEVRVEVVLGQDVQVLGANVLKFAQFLKDAITYFIGRRPTVPLHSSEAIMVYMSLWVILRSRSILAMNGVSALPLRATTAVESEGGGAEEEELGLALGQFIWKGK